VESHGENKETGQLGDSRALWQLCFGGASGLPAANQSTGLPCQLLAPPFPASGFHARVEMLRGSGGENVDQPPSP
jgi:hypothetical protein